MKDSWVLEERWPDEIYFFQKIEKYEREHGEKIPHIPTMVHFEDVELSPGVVDTTDGICSHYEGLLNRIHRCVFFAEFGQKLASFKSKRELLEAIIQAIECERGVVKGLGRRAREREMARCGYQLFER